MMWVHTCIYCIHYFTFWDLTAEFQICPIFSNWQIKHMFPIKLLLLFVNSLVFNSFITHNWFSELFQMGRARRAVGPAWVALLALLSGPSAGHPFSWWPWGGQAATSTTPAPPVQRTQARIARHRTPLVFCKNYLSLPSVSPRADLRKINS